MKNTIEKNDFPDILYIMGTGRSATTIMEILLTNNDCISGVGEVTHIFRDGACLNDICSCGQKTWECNLWSKVFEGLLPSGSSFDYGRDLFRRIDWHSGFYKQALGLFSRKDMNAYQKLNGELFTRVSKITGCGVVVDSSKYASRAIALSMAFRENVKVICLTRSPAGLIQAFKRVDAAEQKPKAIHAIVLYYVFVMLCCRIAIMKIGKQNCVIVTFEELMAQPRKVFEKIERQFGINLNETRAKIAEGAMFKAGHIVTGNRLRKKGAVRFRPKPLGYKLANRVEFIAEKLMRIWGRMLGFNY